MKDNGIIIYTAQGGDVRAAEKLAGLTGAHVTAEPPDKTLRELCVAFTEDGVVLSGGGMELRADLSKMKPRLRRGNLNSEILIRAAKPGALGEAPSALDATAGLGEDSLLLAAAGFTVTMCERDPVIAALLRDGLSRAASDPELSDTVGRMTLIECDSVELMQKNDAYFELILLDPMFPERKKSGLIKKKLQLLQMLESPCDGEEELFCAAYAKKPRKLLIKRPAKGPYLAGKKPDYSITGGTARYDCYKCDNTTG